MLPIGLILLFLTGVGPLLAWRKSTLDEPARLSSSGRRSAGDRHRRRAVRRSASASGRRALLRALRVRRRHDRPGVLARRAASGSGTTGTDFLTALVGLVGRNKRRYGGYIVHLGIVLMFLGFAGQRLQAGRAGAAEARAADDGRPLHASATTASRSATTARSRWSRRTSRVFAGRQADRHDVSGAVVLPQARGGADDRGRDPPRVRAKTSTSCSACLRASRRRSATCGSSSIRWSNWIWFGFGVLAFGTGIALLPERAFSFALREAAGRRGGDDDAALLRRCSCSAASLSAQQRMPARARRRRRRTTRERARAADAARDRLHLRRLRPHDDRRVPQGSMRGVAQDARRAGGADRSGQDARRDHPGIRRRVRQTRRCSARRSTRASTASRGCCRTCSAPTGAVAIGFAAVRWSQTSARQRRSGRDRLIDAAIDERLDDELRNLD